MSSSAETRPAAQAPSDETPEDAEETLENDRSSASPRCMNCETLLQGEYCHRCGQSAQTQRLRFRELAAGLARGVVELDSKMVRTVWHLFTRPGSMTREYVDGNRVTYVSPLRYYVLMVALNIGLSALLGTTDAASAGASNGNAFWDANFVALQISLVYALIAIPIAASQRVLHQRGRLTLAEHYAFLLYLLAQSILVLVLIDVFAVVGTGAELGGDAEGLAWLGVFTVYIVWAGRTFYREAVWHTAWKTAASYAATVVLGGFCGAAAIGLYHLIVG